MANQSNPLIGSNPRATLHSAKCALSYMREWSPREDDGASASNKDVEFGRWLLLGVVEGAINEALTQIAREGER